MLIKTADANRQLEKMLQKSAWRRRMARRHPVAEQAAAPADAAPMSWLTAALPGIRPGPHARQHAKPCSTIVRKPGVPHASRFGGEVSPEAGGSIFPL